MGVPVIWAPVGQQIGYRQWISVLILALTHGVANEAEAARFTVIRMAHAFVESQSLEIVRQPFTDDEGFILVVCEASFIVERELQGRVAAAWTITSRTFVELTTCLCGLPDERVSVRMYVLDTALAPV